MLIGAKKRNVKKIAIGDGAPPVIFTHVGIGAECENIDDAILIEQEKIALAIKNGAHIICDVSTSNKVAYIQERLMQGLTVPFATVTAYEAYNEILGNEVADYTDFLTVFENQCKRGADVITLHATVLRGDESLFSESKNVIPSTSRGGIMMYELMRKFGIENPFYEHFDKVLTIAKKHGVALSFGPTYRPASVLDCNLKGTHLLELKRMAKLVTHAKKAGVTVMIEGVGHAPLNQIGKIIKKSKKICKAPYRCMTVSTDIAIGFDHISSAIASANAVYYGADSVTCVTRSEHLGVPTVKDVEESVISTVIAVYSGYSARTGDFSRDKKMSISRKNQGCVGDLSVTLFPEKALEEYKKRNKGECTMCGKFCPLKKQKEDKNGIF